MATLRVGAHLDFIDANEIRRESLWHRLSRTHPITRTVGHQAFLAGDERDNRLPPQRDDTLIDLTSQQTKRQANHSGPMAEHSLNGVSGLAGIGRAKNSNDTLLIIGNSA